MEEYRGFQEWADGVEPLLIQQAYMESIGLLLGGEEWHLYVWNSFRIRDRDGYPVFSDSWWRVSQEGQESPLGALVGDSVVSITLPPAEGIADLRVRTERGYRIEVFDTYGCDPWFLTVKRDVW